MLKDWCVIIFGTDNLGNKYDSMYTECCEHVTSEDIILQYRALHPKVVHISLHFAIPDEDFLAGKPRLN